LNLSINWSVEDNPFEPDVITTEDILALCGAFDDNALVAAIIGLLLSVNFMFYLGNFRDGLKPFWVAFIDKGSLVTVALMFVVIIVRLLRAG
jgi:hypothetical protein